MADPLIDVVPGLREAVELEARVREEAFLPGAPEFICGVEVLPMDLGHYSMLTAARSPFVTSGHVSPGDVALFMWAVSPAYRTATGCRAMIETISRKLGALYFWGARRRFVVSLRKLDAAKAVSGCREYVDRAFFDSPGGESSNAASYWSAPAGIVGILAAGFGWSEAEIMRIPLRKAWQYLKIAQHIRNPGRPMFNRHSSKVIGDWLTEVNRKNKAA